MKPTHVTPVAPTGMDLVFTYRCPYCGKKNHLVSPLQPETVVCSTCTKSFPVLPVDDRSIHFIHIMLNSGRAAVDQDFV